LQNRGGHKKEIPQTKGGRLRSSEKKKKGVVVEQ